MRKPRFYLALLLLAAFAFGPATRAAADNRSLFALQDASGSTSLVVPYFDSDSIVSLMNVGTDVAFVSVVYRDLAGTDKSPASSIFTLDNGATLRWMPASGSPTVLDSVGNPIPIMLGPDTTGSATFSSTQPLAGILEIERPGETLGFTLPDGQGAARSAAFTLRAPYLRPGSTVALRNLSSSMATYVVDYRDLSGSIITTAMHSLAANATDYFEPFADETNLTGSEASATVTSDQPLAGQMELAGAVDNGGYTLIDDGGSTVVQIPYIRPNSFIAITNVGTSMAHVDTAYYDLDGGLLVASMRSLAASATERWEPFVDEAGLTGTAANATITSDQPHIGLLELSLANGSTGVSRLSASATMLAVPFMRAGSTLRVRSLAFGEVTVMFTFNNLDGTSLTTTPRTIGALATDVWSPFGDDPDLAEVDEASVTIVSTSQIVGQLELGGIDSDLDGLTDDEETNVYQTDPNDSDSDADGFFDGQEIDDGTDPNNPSSNLPKSIVWVKLGYSGIKKGTFEEPVALLGEALKIVTSGGAVKFANGGNTDETGVVDQPVQLVATNGIVTIGLP